MGHSIKSSLQNDPELASLYELYLSCRQQSVVTYQTSKGKETVQKLKTFTTGFIQLPEEGGILDQPHRVMTFMESFLQGDEHGFWNDKR